MILQQESGLPLICKIDIIREDNLKNCIVLSIPDWLFICHGDFLCIRLARIANQTPGCEYEFMSAMCECYVLSCDQSIFSVETTKTADWPGVYLVLTTVYYSLTINYGVTSKYLAIFPPNPYSAIFTFLM